MGCTEVDDGRQTLSVVELGDAYALLGLLDILFLGKQRFPGLVQGQQGGLDFELDGVRKALLGEFDLPDRGLGLGDLGRGLKAVEEGDVQDQVEGVEILPVLPA